MCNFSPWNLSGPKSSHTRKHLRCHPSIRSTLRPEQRVLGAAAVAPVLTHVSCMTSPWDLLSLLALNHCVCCVSSLLSICLLDYLDKRQHLFIFAPPVPPSFFLFTDRMRLSRYEEEPLTETHLCLFYSATGIYCIRTHTHTHTEGVRRTCCGANMPSCTSTHPQCFLAGKPHSVFSQRTSDLTHNQMMTPSHTHTSHTFTPVSVSHSEVTAMTFLKKPSTHSSKSSAAYSSIALTCVWGSGSRPVARKWRHLCWRWRKGRERWRLVEEDWPLLPSLDTATLWQLLSQLGSHLQRLEDRSAVGGQFGVGGLAEELGEGSDGVQFVCWHLRRRNNVLHKELNSFYNSVNEEIISDGHGYG